MRYRCHIVLGGPRAILEKLRARIDTESPVVDRPARASLDLVLMSDTAEYEAVCREAEMHGLSCFVRKEAVFAPEEIAGAELVTAQGTRWLSDTFDEYEEPEYRDQGRCAVCGRGATGLRRPLRIRPGKMPARGHLLRIPPAILVVTAKLAEIIRDQGWSGVRLGRVHEAASGVPSERFWQLEITSVLPPMSRKSYERSCIPDHCASCKRHGYQLVGEVPIYSRGVLENACDWNYSTEWLAPHAVGCPELVVRGRVARSLARIDKVRWFPVRIE